ncbi:exopolysaccharide biosynthesis protein [Lacibacterium aquatile]|uniref:Exopolysaccharide biosynthesis protein n=1 Tax=Lacibacterium aquatile TaxID=1168082 RepID=A0ABW5DRN0_9PROT
MADQTIDETTHKPSASQLLIDVVRAHPAERISLGDLVDGLGHHAFGLLLLLLAIPNSVPIPGLPGVSTLFGLPMMLFASQLAFGMPRPWLPQYLRKKTLARLDLIHLLERAQPYVAKVERSLRPRLHAFTTATLRRVSGAVIFAMATLMALPIVFGNFVPALAILLISLALIEEDGLMMVFGFIVSIVAAAIVSLIVYIGIEAIQMALSRFFGF